MPDLRCTSSAGSLPAGKHKLSSRRAKNCQMVSLISLVAQPCLKEFGHPAWGRLFVRQRLLRPVTFLPGALPPTASQRDPQARYPPRPDSSALAVQDLHIPGMDAHATKGAESHACSARRPPSCLCHCTMPGHASRSPVLVSAPLVPGELDTPVSVSALPAAGGIATPVDCSADPPPVPGTAPGMAAAPA